MSAAVIERLIEAREQVRTEDDPIVELLLAAADMAARGAEFPLMAAAEMLDRMCINELPHPEAIEAALAAREVGALYGAPMSIEAYLEAAYRLMEHA